MLYIHTHTHLQDFVPVAGQFWPASYCLVPDHWEVGHAAEVLRDCDCVIHVEDNVPPTARNKDRLSWSLENLQLNINKFSVCGYYLQY